MAGYVQINDWEDGTNEGRFDTITEAEAYVLENEMDVVVYDFTSLSGMGYRFNNEIADRRKEREMDEFVHLSRYVWELTKSGYTLRVTVDGDRALSVVVNPQKEEVDATVFTGRTAFKEARWMLDTAIESGE